MLKLTIVICLAYLVSALAQARWLFFSTQPGKNYLFRTCSFVSILSHGYLLYLLIETPNGQNLYSLVLLSLIFWLLNITIFLSIHLAKVENLALFAYPLTICTLIITCLNPGSDVIQTGRFEGMVSHIFLSLLSASTISLAFLQAILLGMQNNFLKNHKHLILLRLLPPLQTMESLLFTFLWLGLLFLSLALVSGFWFQYNHPELKHNPEIFLSLISWIVIAFLLIGRYRLGWRLQKALIGTTLGFSLIFVSYFSTHL